MSSSLIVGPLQAYRCWHVSWQGDVPIMRSLYFSTVWPADAPLRATCETVSNSLLAWVRGLFSDPAATPKHPAPAWGCQCGVYGLAHLEGDELEKTPQVRGRDPDRGIAALGVVLLWGRVIQHEHGYRAEYARPLKLLTVAPQFRTRNVAALLEAVAQRYGIQLVAGTRELR